MRKTRIKDIFIVHNLITLDEMRVIHECLEKITWLPDTNSLNEHADIGRLGNKGGLWQTTSSILENKNFLIKENIEKDFSCKIGYEGMATIIKHHIGWTLEYHADCDTGISTYSGYPGRDISSILYLTENFEGGNLVFPDLDIEIEPSAGSVVYFPGDRKHMHEVTEVLSGNRSTCNSFWHILSEEKQ